MALAFLVSRPAGWATGLGYHQCPAGTVPGACRAARWHDAASARVPHGTADETARIFALQEEVEQPKAAVASHAVVDRAVEVMVTLGRMQPDQGWIVLKEVSQHTDAKLRHLAELILVRGRTGETRGSVLLGGDLLAQPSEAAAEQA
ncbi:ANTAR domain-containing protein [Streptomyces sp. NBC_01334]|uniref:ANTAR domain-containing protein n=1 Tax=Streptomyces sp. NBC_01334 TaxID=2903827 RepID=UPI002E10FFEE